MIENGRWQELRRRGRVVAALHRAAAAHERTARMHEYAARLHADAQTVFRNSRLFEAAAHEHKLATTNLMAASQQRQLACADWRRAQYLRDVSSVQFQSRGS